MGRTAGGAVAADLAQIVQHPLVEAAQLLQLPGGESPQHLLVYRVEDLGALLHRPAAPVVRNTRLHRASAGSASLRT